MAVMAPPNDLSALEAAIRSAVSTGVYADADRLLSGYCQQLKTADQILHARNLIEWMFRMTSAARAHDMGHLKNLSAVAQYLRRPPDRHRTLQIEG
jgi:hypothetical protein